MNELVDVAPVTPTAMDALRVPKISANDEEALVAAANDSGRDQAVAQLDAFFPGLALPDAAQTTDATTLRVHASKSGLVEALNPHALLAELLSNRSLQPPQIRMAKDGAATDVAPLLEVGQPQPLGKVGPRPAVLAQAMHDGNTIVLDGVDLRDARSSRLCELFERALAMTVTINGYLSYRPFMSFGAHWDTQEVVILQLLGQKDWAVHQPIALSMTRGAFPRDACGDLAWQGRLHVGDAMYVPRGWSHSVSSVDELSYHYTITMGRTTGVDALQFALEHLNEKSDQSAYLVPSPITAREQAWPDPFDPGEIAAMDSLVALAEVRRRMAVVARPTQRYSHLRRVLNDVQVDFQLRFPYGGGWLIGQHDEPSMVSLGAGRKLFHVAKQALPALMKWSDGLVHAPANGDEADLARRLVALDVMEVVDDPIPWPHRGVRG